MRKAMARQNVTLCVECRITKRKLKELIDRDFAGVRDATAGGDETALQRFFINARSILEQEHLAWSLVIPVDQGVTSQQEPNRNE